MGDTSISWTDKTWNCVRGCSRVSEGCRHCYAERQALRFNGPGQPYEGLVTSKRRDVRQMKIVNGEPTADTRTISRTEPHWTGVVRFVAEHLADPLKWKKPCRVFVNSMSDLFHDELSDEQIAAVFGVMAACPQHTFQVLTKRAKRMREWFAWVVGLDQDAWTECHAAALALDVDGVIHTRSGEAPGRPWPLPNVWCGVSVENQDAADERIPELLDTPAAIRFLSCEPLLGPLNLDRWMHRCESCVCSTCPVGFDDDTGMGQRRLGWLIAGCESGPGARRCDVAWLRSLRDQCAAASVPYWLKQAEETADCGEDGILQAGDDDSIAFDDGSKMKARRPGGNHIIELPYLDGVQHAALPESKQ